MTNLYPSLTITKSYRGRRPLNAPALLENGPTDCDDYCKRLDGERVQEWVRRNCFEQAEEAEEEDDEEEDEKEDEKEEEEDEEEDDEDDEEDSLDPWEPLVYNGGGAPMENEGETEGVLVISDSSDEDKEMGEEDDKEDKEEGDMASTGIVGKGPENMDQVVPTLEPSGGIFSGLDISREAVENSKPFADIFEDCLGEMDILGELLGSDKED